MTPSRHPLSVCLSVCHTHTHTHTLTHTYIHTLTHISPHTHTHTCKQSACKLTRTHKARQHTDTHRQRYAQCRSPIATRYKPEESNKSVYVSGRSRGRREGRECESGIFTYLFYIYFNLKYTFLSPCDKGKF